MAADPTARLEARGVRVRFGGLSALNGIDLEVGPGEIAGLIGPNGAGKTTLFNVMTGVQPMTQGRVFLDGADISDWSPHRRGRAGVIRTARRLFDGLVFPR